MPIRLNAGSLKGLQLKQPPSEITRPTSAKVREAVLNILAPDLEGSTFLDLFAGTGSMGLEALSQGAGQVYAYDFAPQAISALKANKTKVAERQGALAERLQVVRFDLGSLAETAEHSAGRGKGKQKKTPRLPTIPPFDFLWADPPYASAVAWLPKVLESFAPFAKPGGRMLCEISRRQDKELLASMDELHFLAQGWQTLEPRRYGDTALCSWIKMDQDA